MVIPMVHHATMSRPDPEFPHVPKRGRTARLVVWSGAVLLLLLGASWGLQFALLKIAAGSRVGELSILTGSMAMLAVAYLATLAARKEWFRTTWRHVRFFIISGLFGYVIPLGGVLWVADQLSAGLIVLYTEALDPVFTVAIVLFLRTEILSRRRLGAVAIALAGVAVAMWPDVTATADARALGLLIVLIVPLAYAIDGVYVSSCWPQDLSALQVVTGEAFAGAAMLFPIWLMLEGFTGLPGSLGPAEWAILAFVPVSYLEVYLYFYLLKTQGAVFVAFGCFVSLFAGFLWGMALLGERHGPMVWFAVLLVSIALYLMTVRRRATATAPATSES